MIKTLWSGVNLEQYNEWFPLTGKITVTPEKYIKTWPDVNEWFKTFALRAQNDINAYLQDILRKFDFETFIDARIKETLTDMVFLVVEHWVYNHTPIELNTEGAMVFNNGQTQINNFATPTINIYDLHPSRMKIWANFTGLKQIFDTYEEEGLVDANLIDLDQYYSKTETDAAIADAISEVDLSIYETKENHRSDIDTLDTRIFWKESKDGSVVFPKKDGQSLVIARQSDNFQVELHPRDLVFFDSSGANGGTITGLKDPTTGVEAANKNYVDKQDNILQNNINKKQDNLVSGTNLKTINGTSLLGSGNIVINTNTNNWIPGEYKHVPAVIDLNGNITPKPKLPIGWKVVNNYDDNTPTILANIPKSGTGTNSIINNFAAGNAYTLELTAIQGTSCFSLFKITDNNAKKTGQLGFLNTILIQYDPDGTFEVERKTHYLRMSKLEALKTKRPDTYTNYLVPRKDLKR